MAEMYVAMHDAVGRVLAASFGGSAGSKPWYLEPEGQIIGATGEWAEREVDRLALMFPGRVTDRTH